MEDAVSILEIVKRYNGDTWFFPLLMAAAAYLLVKADRENRRNILLVTAAAVLCVFNDLAYKIAGHLVGEETYYRFLWMIPAVPILGYVAVDAVTAQKTVLRKGIAAVASAVIIMLAGVPYVSAESFTAPSQVNYLSPETEEVCNMISGDKEMESPVVASDFNLARSLRMYDPTIQNAILRDTYGYDDVMPLKGAERVRQHRLLCIVMGWELGPKKMRRALERSNTDYVVIETAYDMDERMQEIGCVIVGRTSSYTVYRVD
ncbi:MAG: hypothetical protein Q4C50_08645 [Eubacteriales bacterium]|nr:hypothetical protein [Eubacteriales bacterium]